MEEEEEYEEPSQEDEEALKRLAMAMQGNAASPDDKNNVFAFLNSVASSPDTTKTGFLRDDKDLDEVGTPKLPVRTFHSLALIADQIIGNEYLKNYFEREAEIITKTSLSRNAKLLSLGVLQKKEVADVTNRPRRQNKSWFGSKTKATPYSPQ